MDSVKFTNQNQRKSIDSRSTLGEQNVGAPENLTRRCGAAEEVREVLKMALPVSWYLAFEQVSPFTDLTD